MTEILICLEKKIKTDIYIFFSCTRNKKNLFIRNSRPILSYTCDATIKVHVIRYEELQPTASRGVKAWPPEPP